MRIAYLDSSIIARRYLPNDAGHAEANSIIDDPDTATVTATWTRIEVSGALVRAARAAAVPPEGLLARLDADLDEVFTMLSVDQADAEQHALETVRSSGIRALDAWHIAIAALTLPELAGPGDEAVFVTRDDLQAAAARVRGLDVV